MKHGVMTVAVESMGAAKQKAKGKLHMPNGDGGTSPPGGGKATSFQFWRCVVILMVIGCTVAAAMWGFLAGMGDFIKLQQGDVFFSQNDGLFGGGEVAYIETDDTQCLGRRVYMYDMPPQFNSDVLDKFCLEKYWWMNMCESYINTGFGLKMEHVMEPVDGWYRTEQFALEVMVHERFKKYKCLTNNPDRADLFYLPYYVGLDLSIYIFSDATQMKDLLLERFVGWLLAQPAFVKSGGENHVMVLSRIIWDFTRQVESTGWGNALLNSFELQNVTKLMIERAGRDLKNIAIPYPTSFHPGSDGELELWRKKVSEAKRDKLASFVGGPRNATEKPVMAIRDILFKACNASHKCENLVCGKYAGDPDKVDCTKNPHAITNVFMAAKFCFQPAGDSPTRKGVFDCLVAGTIPVFFNPATAYTQYLWHLPVNGSDYSVFIPVEEVLSGEIDVMEVLEAIPEEKIQKMLNVIHEKVIPAIVFDLPDRDPNKKAKDAFDITLEHLLDPNYRTYPVPEQAPSHNSDTQS